MREGKNFSKIWKKITAFLLVSVMFLSSIPGPDSIAADNGENMAEKGVHTEGGIFTEHDDSQVQPDNQNPFADPKEGEQIPTESVLPEDNSTEIGTDEIPTDTVQPDDTFTDGDLPEDNLEEGDEAEGTQTLVFEDGSMKVTATAEAGVIPADTFLQVIPVVQENAETLVQYQELEGKLQEKAALEGYSVTGFLAYDITFVNAEGQQIEASGDVAVTIEYSQAAIPTSVFEKQTENNNVTLMYLERYDDGQTEVIDMGQFLNGPLKVLDLIADNQVARAEFTDSRASLYTFVWSGTEMEETPDEEENENLDGEEPLNFVPMTGKLEIIAEDVVLRAEPSIEGEIVEVVPAGTYLELLGMVENGTEAWYKALYEGTEVYVRSDMAKVAEEDASEKEEEESEDTPRMLEYENDSVKIAVSEVTEGAIPEGASLRVVPVEPDNANTAALHQEVQQKLEEKAENEEYDITGFLAYDITFVDENGNKLEPDGQVQVSMEYKEAAVPENVKDNAAESTDVTVMHLEEDAEGQVAQVVDMGQSNQLRTMETTADKEVQKAEFITESFSVYTITWKNEQGKKTRTLKINYVDENGKSIDGKTGSQILVGEEIINLELSDYEMKINGYEHLRTTMDKYTNTREIKQIRRSDDSIQYLAKSSQNYWQNWNIYNNTYNVYIVYKKLQTTVQIHYVDQNGQPISGMSPEDIGLNETNNEINLEECKKDIKDYLHLRTVADQYKGTEEIISIQYKDGKLQCLYNDVWRDWNGVNKKYNIYLVYKAIPVIPPTELLPLGEPDHNKYIRKNEQDYTLSLDVTGKQGTATPIDILLIVDKSGSMKDDNRYESVNTAIKSLTDTLKEAEIKTQISLSVVTFSGPTKSGDNDSSIRDNTQDASQAVGWKELKDFNFTLKNSDCDGGTNWQAGIHTGETMWNNRPKENRKYVVFLTDGNPTFRHPASNGVTQYNKTQGTGSSDPSSNNYNYAVNEWAQASTLSDPVTTRYIVDANPQNTVNGRCAEFATAVKGTVLAGSDKGELERSFKEIADGIVRPAYTDVYISDTLSEYVDFAEDTPVVTAYRVKKNNDGTETDLPMAATEYTVDVDKDSKTVKVYLMHGKQLEEGVTYRIKFNVKTTEEAYYQYWNAGRYNEIGDVDTDAWDNNPKTSSGKPGFHSNGNAIVGYSENGSNSATALYKHPVVQVDADTVQMSVQKIWVGQKLDQVNVELKAKVKINGEDKELSHDLYGSLPEDMTVTLNAAGEWAHTWAALPQYYYYYPEEGSKLARAEISYTIDEPNVPAGYTKEVSEADESGKVIITNTQGGSLIVEKSWSDGADKHTKDTIYVGLYKKVAEALEPVEGKVEKLSASTEWKTVFDRLGEGNYIAKELELVEHVTEADFTITEAEDTIYYKGIDDGGMLLAGEFEYKVSYSEPQLIEETPNDYKMTVTNTKQLNIPVEKIWSDEASDSSNYNEHKVYVGLYTVDGNKITAVKDKILELKYNTEKAKCWKGSFTALDPEKKYTVRELIQDDAGEITIDNVKYTPIEEGGVYTEGGKSYRVSYKENEEGGFTITNTRLNTLTIVKKGKEDENPLLAGARFTLDKKLSDGSWKKMIQENGKDYLETDEDGKAVFSNLEDGEYRITEIQSPAGYSLLVNPIEVMLPYTSEMAGDTVTTGDGVTIGGTTYYYDITYTILNNKLFTMPEGGGTGAKGIILAGIFMMLAAGGYSLIFYRRRRRLVRK